MFRVATLCLLVAIAVVPMASAETPEASVIIDRVIAAVGGDAFSTLGVLKLDVTAEEIRNDGTSFNRQFSAYVDTAELSNLRMEMPGGIVIARRGDEGWATDKGKYDERPQTSYMAKGTINQQLYTLLLPYSLKMGGVWVKEVRETQWDGREAWALHTPFAKGFFVSPVLTTTWRVVVDKEDYSILGVDFVPPVDLRDVQPVGIRYRYLKYDEINGAKVPSQILAVGINYEGRESGATRVTKVSPTVYGPWEPRLFLSPPALDALEQD